MSTAKRFIRLSDGANIAPPRIRRLARRLSRDGRGIAAVEFALILPLMLMIYLGLVEMSRGLRAAQKLDLIAHVLADLTAQQLTCATSTIAACLTESDVQAIFSAATALMSPLPTTPATNLKMTISQVEIVSPSANNWQAKVKWSVPKNSAQSRSCGVLGVASSTDKPVYYTKMPASYTTKSGGVDPVTGPVIVADVIYTYTPGLNFEMFKWKSSPTWTMQRTSYAPVRNTFTPSNILFLGTSGTICP